MEVNILPSENVNLLSKNENSDSIEKVNSPEDFTIDDEKYELYDRNIRVWGKENQMKLSNSHVLLINLTCSVTELAKNLLLAGINLYLYDKDQKGNNKKVSEREVNSNYFLNSANLNKDRINILKECLQSINLFASVKELESLDKLDDIQCVCVGFSSFNNLNFYEDFFTKRNMPFYCINTSGMYSFFYNNLVINQIVEKEKSSPGIKGSSRYKKNKVQCLSFSKQIDTYFENLKNSKSNSRKKILRNNLYNAVCLLQLYERRAVPGEDLNVFQKKLLFAENFLKQHNIDFLSSSGEFQKIFQKLIKNFNSEFNPVCSIIAGIVSQEILKVLTKSEEAYVSLYTYDSEQESGNFLDLLSI